MTTASPLGPSAVSFHVTGSNRAEITAKAKRRGEAFFGKPVDRFEYSNVRCADTKLEFHADVVAWI